MPALTFTVPGPVVPWQRTASVGGRRLTPKRQRDYQGLVRRTAAQHILASRLVAGGWPLVERMSVSIFYVPHDRRRRDIDNVAKTIMDACNGVLWADDSQIDVLHVERVHDGDPGVTVCVMAAA